MMKFETDSAAKTKYVLMRVKHMKQTAMTSVVEFIWYLTVMQNAVPIIPHDRLLDWF